MGGFGDPETVVGGTYRDRATGKATFVVESEHEPAGHVAGVLTVDGKRESGLYRWAEFHRLFVPAALDREESNE